MSAKQTLQERFIAALIKRGEQEVKRTTHKRIVYTRSITDAHGDIKYYYIGANGSLRIGNTSSQSFPVSAAYKQKLLSELEK